MKNRRYIIIVTITLLIIGVKGSLFSYTYMGYKWAANKMPVNYYINPAGFPAGSIDAINAGFSVWQSASNNWLRFSYQGTTTLTGSGDRINKVWYGTTAYPYRLAETWWD